MRYFDSISLVQTSYSFLSSKVRRIEMFWFLRSIPKVCMWYNANNASCKLQPYLCWCSTMDYRPIHILQILIGIESESIYNIDHSQSNPTWRWFTIHVRLNHSWMWMRVCYIWFILCIHAYKFTHTNTAMHMRIHMHTYKHC